MNNRSAHHGGFIHGLLHHLQLALIVASVVALLHAGHLLGWLDVAMMRLAAEVQGSSPSEVKAPPLPPENLPVVFTISQKLYEEAFLQTSPLDRGKLATIVNAIASRTPAPSTLVIDIDMSPMAGPEDDTGQKALNEALTALVAKGTRLVMTVPFRVRSTELVQRKARWMRAMCSLTIPAKNKEHGPSPGVVFALGEAMTNLGQVLQYDMHRPTLGVVAREPLGTHHRADRICGAVKAGADSSRLTEALLSSAYTDEAHEAHEQKLLPFRSNDLPQIVAATVPFIVLNELPALPGGKPHDFTGRTVFLGGSFDRGDQFDLPLAEGKVPGVLIHALVFASEAMRIDDWLPVCEFLLDIPVGFVCALWFEWLWTRHRRIHAMALEHGGLPLYLRSKLSWLLIPATLMLLLLGFALWAVHFMYPRGEWLNVGPVMIGVAAKFLLSSIASSGEAAQGHAHHVAPPRLYVRLDWGLVLGLVAVTFAVTIWGH